MISAKWTKNLLQKIAAILKLNRIWIEAKNNVTMNHQSNCLQIQN